MDGPSAPTSANDQFVYPTGSRYLDQYIAPDMDVQRFYSNFTVSPPTPFPFEESMDQSWSAGYTPMTFLNTDLNCESFIDSNLRTAETDDIVPYGVAPVGQHTPGCISDNAAVPETSAGIPQISPELFFPGPGWNFIGHYDRQQSETSQASSNFPSSQNGRTTPGSSQDAHRSPPKDFNKQESSLMVNNYRKRKTDPEGMNPMTIIFPLNGSVAHRQGRAKTPFSRTRRPEVALVRKVGSCARCKIQRVSSKFPRPCDVCIRAAGNDKVLARSLCNRDTLFEIRFGQFDLLFESFSQDFVYNEVRWYHGTPRQINLALIFDQYSPNKQMLALTVQDYSQSEFEDPIIYHRLATDEGHFDVVQSQRCAIIPNGLPRVEELLAWAQIDTATTEVSPVQRLITALHGFMQTYCQNTPELPLSGLLDSSVRILKLLHCWRSGKIVPSNSDDPSEYWAPKAVSSQLLVVIKKGIRAEEMFVLKQLEKLMYGGSGPGQHNMIPLWACLWCLILTYRDCMAVYKKFKGAPAVNRGQPGCSDYEGLIGSSKLMYDTLTAHYAALFRVSSPLSINWAREKNFRLLGGSKRLRDAFYNLRSELFTFYELSDELLEEDILLKDRIIYRERLLKSD